MTPDNTRVIEDKSTSNWRILLAKQGLQEAQMGNGLIQQLFGESVQVGAWENPLGQFAPEPLLQDTTSYRGVGKADIMIHYSRALFSRLRGYNLQNEEEWTPEAMVQRGILDLSVHDQDASWVSSSLTSLARRLTSNDPKKRLSYDDPASRAEYADLTEKAFKLLNEQQILEPNNPEDLAQEKVSVVLYRAGEPATQFTLGEHYDSNKIVGIGEKRAHLKEEENGDVALVMYGATREELQRLDGQDLLICDPAFATGSSLLSVVFAMEKYGFKPRSIELRSVAATRAGLDLTKEILEALGIKFIAKVLAVGLFLNDRYYIGDADHDPVVADAGDGLRGTKNQIDPNNDLREQL